MSCRQRQSCTGPVVFIQKHYLPSYSYYVFEISKREGVSALQPNTSLPPTPCRKQKARSEALFKALHCKRRYEVEDRVQYFPIFASTVWLETQVSHWFLQVFHNTARCMKIAGYSSSPLLCLLSEPTEKWCCGRLVQEVLTELDIVYESAGNKHSSRWEVLLATS